MRLHTIWAVEHVVLSVPEHFHNYYQFMFCRGGTGEITVGENRYAISEGEVCLAAPMVKHSIVQNDGMQLIEVKFVVEDRYLDEKLRKLPENFRIEDPFIIERFNTLLSEFYNEDFCFCEVVNSELFLLLIYIMRKNLVTEELPNFSTTQIVAIQNGQSDIELETCFDRIVQYIGGHIDRQITVEDLAERAHLDKSYFTVRFKEIYGISPMRYVAHMRIERAKVLLTTSSMTITEIASSTGFSSIHYFSRQFKSRVGLTPAGYRNMDKYHKKKKTQVYNINK